MSQLVVTVGVSLFTSASWKPSFAERVPDYERWLAAPYDRDPSARASMAELAADGSLLKGEAIRLAIHRQLEKEMMARRWSSLDALEELTLANVGRFSAEIATLLELWRAEGRRGDLGGDLAAFLARYERMEVLTPRSPENEAHLAGRYVVEIFRKLGSATEFYLDGQTLGTLLGGLESYLGSLPKDAAFDFLVSGGYKAFAALIGRFVAERPHWRSFYVHESGLGEGTVLVSETRKGVVLPLTMGAHPFGPK